MTATERERLAWLETALAAALELIREDHRAGLWLDLCHRGAEEPLQEGRRARIQKRQA